MLVFSWHVVGLLVSCNGCLVAVSLGFVRLIPVIREILTRMLYFVPAVIENTAQGKPEGRGDAERQAVEDDNYATHVLIHGIVTPTESYDADLDSKHDSETNADDQIEFVQHLSDHDGFPVADDGGEPNAFTQAQSHTDVLLVHASESGTKERQNADQHGTREHTASTAARISRSDLGYAH